MGLKVGDTVTLTGFAPMSTMGEYEGSCGIVKTIAESNLGNIVTVELTDGGTIQTRSQFCKKEA